MPAKEGFSIFYFDVYHNRFQLEMPFNVSRASLLLWCIIVLLLAFIPPEKCCARNPHNPLTYIVKKGDTLSEIAFYFGVSIAALRRLNHISQDRIYPGQRIMLNDLQEKADEKYMVKRGDTLWGIAGLFGLSLSELKELNPIRGDKIYPGQELKLGVRAHAYMESYQVKPGDYLGRIARLHQMSVAELKRVNGLRTSVINPRDTLRVRPLLNRGGLHDKKPIGAIGVTFHQMASERSRRRMDLTTMDALKQTAKPVSITLRVPIDRHSATISGQKNCGMSSSEKFRVFRASAMHCEDGMLFWTPDMAVWTREPWPGCWMVTAMRFMLWRMNMCMMWRYEYTSF
jgi:LysM repeat protein